MGTILEWRFPLAVEREKNEAILKKNSFEAKHSPHLVRLYLCSQVRAVQVITEFAKNPAAAAAGR
jgi:hypothetical protein